MEDEVIRGATVILQGDITWPPPPPTISVSPAPQTEAPAVKTETVQAPGWVVVIKQFVPMLLAALLLFAVGTVAPPAFMEHFTIFVLACFVGYQVIWNVTPSLHTPLMSVTNAISGIIVIGALVQISSSDLLITLISGFAILIASINIAGGFLVTRRMLEMFKIGD